MWNSLDLTAKLRRGLGNLGGVCLTSALNLGIDFFAGRTSVFVSGSVRKQRGENIEGSSKETNEVGKAVGRKAATIHKAGLVAGLMYGSAGFWLDKS